jgi:hypothetical protein
MSPPGEPLNFIFTPAFQRNAATYEANFPGLEEQIRASIAEAAPGSLTVIWRKKGKLGQAFKGMKVAVEAKDVQGRHSLFEIFYVGRGDQRSPVRLTQGKFQRESCY